MTPQIGEYWYLAVKIMTTKNDKDYIDNRQILAKCIAITETGPVFLNQNIFNNVSIYDNNNGYKFKLICKAEEDNKVKIELNWFWKLLGY